MPPRPLLRGNDPDEAQLLVWQVRDLLWLLEHRADNFEQKRNMVAVLGYVVPRDERELDLIIRTLRKAAHPGRTGGIH